MMTMRRIDVAAIEAARRMAENEIAGASSRPQRMLTRPGSDPRKRSSRT